MANERITENIVRDRLRVLGYREDAAKVQVEEQTSEVEAVRKLLRNASKTGNNGRGSPEFIIHSRLHPDFLIVIECKANVSKHESPARDQPVDFAVDGALHYAKFLRRGFNVLAVAVSGQRPSALEVSCFLWPKNADAAKPLTNEGGVEVSELLPFEDFLRLSSFDPEVARNRHDDLMAYSRELHEFMRDHAKLTESEKPLLVSGTLIALRNEGFSASFDRYTPEALQRQWMAVIKEEIDAAALPNSKKANMTQPYSSIAVHPELGKATPKFPKGVLYQLIASLNEKVWPEWR